MTEEKAPEPNTEAISDTQDPVIPPNSADTPAAAEANQPAAEAPPPPPEPLTPERAEAENRRNDLFIMASAIVVAFLLGLFKITDNDLWIHLKSGWQIDQEGVPATDSFAYTTGDQSWVNLNWLYDWGLYHTELAESRSRVRQLVADYRKLIENRQQPKFDDQGRDVTKPLSDEQRQELEQAFTQLASTADTSDTYQMRLAAERTAELVQAAEIRLPVVSQESEKGNYPALARYTSQGGEALISLMVPIVVKGLLLAGIAAMLILLRHPGPTRWWTAVVAVLVLVAMGDRLTLTPEVFSLFFLSVVFWILHAFQTGRPWAVWLLVPLEMLWVNVDSFFALGIVLAAIVLLPKMVAQPAGDGESQPPQGNPKSLAGALVLSIVATLANPFGVRAWAVPFEWTRDILGRVSYVAASFAQLCGSDAPWVSDARSRGNELHTLAPDLFTPLSRAFVNTIREVSIPPIVTMILILAAVVSFVLNRRRFQVTRLLVLLVCLGMFLMAYRYVSIVAMAAGVMLCLNGQEWFLDRFGTETRITRGWLIWSQGARAITILAIVGVAIAGITGRVGAAAGSEFGLGIQWVKFELETGKFLREAKLKGHALNTVPLQGNLLMWSNYPAGKVFLDGRVELHKERLPEFETLKRALRGPIDDSGGLGSTPVAPDTPATEPLDDDAWKPILDKYNISHVVLNISAFADHVLFLRTYQRLWRSDEWKLVHRDSSSAIFGRIDLPAGHALAEDAAWFKQNTLDPARLVYKENAMPLPDPPATVSLPTFIDRFWQTRRIPSTQTIIGTHYLNPTLGVGDSPPPYFMVPTENCILAIRHARNGLATQQRVSPLGYAVLFRAYFYLYNTEMSLVPSPDVNELRHLELLAALNQLVAANPDNLEARLQLAFRYAGLRYFDLADEQFEAVIKLMPEDATIENLLLDGGQMGKFEKSNIVGFSENLKTEIERVMFDLQQLSGNQMPPPMVQANYLMQRGCLRMAIDKLTEASVLATAGTDVSPFLAQLYVRIGQPGDPEHGAERELLNMQGTGGLRPGAKKELWGMVKLMQGDYTQARTLMEDAIAETRHAMSKDSLSGLTDQLRSGMLLNMALAPATSIEDADRQATLEFHLGMLQLEAGEPKEAERHFKQALAVREDISYRPIIGFYLEKLTGEKLEPLPDLPMEEETRPPAAGTSTPARPATVPPKPSNSPEKPANKQ